MTAVSDPVTVTLVPALNLKQTTLKKFVVNFGTVVADLKASDVAVEEVVVGPSGEYRVNSMVKAVTMADDKKSATVELFYAMNDGVKYEVTVKGYDMETLVASAGKPVAMSVYAIDTTYRPIVAGQVTVGHDTTLKYTLIDANGVDVTTGDKAEENKVVFNVKYTGKSGANYEMSYYAGYATFDFTEVGDSAVVTAEYATGEYKDNVEVKVTAPAVPFYAVAKQLVTIKSVANYTTQTPGWINYWSANKDIVKLGQTNNLVVRVVLADGKELDVYKQGQTIVDREGVTHGYVTVEATNSSRDYIDVDAFVLGSEGTPADSINSEGQKIVLRPRKVGTAQLMVYYNAYLPDGSIQKTAIAPVVIKVKEAPTLGAVQFNYAGNNPATVILSNKPNENDLWNSSVSVQIKDQYGDDYNGASFLEIKGTSTAADELANIGIVRNGSNIDIYGEHFHNKILAMNANITDTTKQNSISGKFMYTVKYQDNATKAIKTNTIIVDIRGRVTNSVKGTDLAGATGGNIARFDHYDPWNAKDEKTLTFKVFDKMNGANIAKQGIKPYSDITNINTATDGYYFKVFKDGVDVTKTLLETTADVYGYNLYQAVFDSVTREATPLLTYTNNEVTLRFSSVKQDVHGNYVVAYDYVGAGNYQFVVYEVGESRYSTPTNTIKVATPVSNATRAVSVSCDPLKYNLTGRKAVVIKNATGTVPASAADVDALAILNCFDFTDKSGNAFDHYSTGNSNTNAVFNGSGIKYEVNLNDERQLPNSIYVSSITFYEVVKKAPEDLPWTTENEAADDPNTPYVEANIETVYAAYTVPVNCYIEYQAEQ